jgi:hypothetical protein
MFFQGQLKKKIVKKLYCIIWNFYKQKTKFVAMLTLEAI